VIRRLALCAVATLFAFGGFGAALPAVGRGGFLIPAALLAFAGFISPGRLLGPVLCLSSLAGLIPLFSGTRPDFPWSSFLVLWFCVGWSFRRLAAPESPKAWTRLDEALAALAVLWAIAAISAAASARSLWATARLMNGRIVNVQGMSDGTAIRDNLLSLTVVFAGILLFALMGSLDAPGRISALTGLLVGAGLSGGCAFLQSVGVIPAPRLDYWRTVERFHGLSSDPNALGILAGLALGPSAVRALRPGRGRWGWAALALALLGGLGASGSRSGFVIAAFGLVGAAFVARRGKARFSGAWVLLASLAVLLGAALAASRWAGGLLPRLAQTFRGGVPVAARLSERPLLWRAAGQAFLAHPFAGLGWNAYSWQLANIARSGGWSLPGYDNPGNFYLQVLCEEGLFGAIVFFLFAGLAALISYRALRERRDQDPRQSVLGATLLGFFTALLVGSHLLAAEVSLAFFGFLACLAPLESRAFGLAGRALAWSGVALASVAFGASLLPTRLPDEAFRYGPRIGIFDLERSAAGPFRWAARRSAWRMAPGEEHRLVLFFRNSVHPSETLRIRADGRVLASRELRRDEPVTLRLSASPSRPTVFELLNASSFHAGGEDARELSLQLFELPISR
jgi:O-antigen ligase